MTNLKTDKHLIEFFLNIVKINSPTGTEDKLLQYLLKVANEIGLNSNLDSFGNLIINVDGKGAPLFLGAHADTVQPGENIKPKVTSGLIKSDGKTILGADNKAAIAAIFAVLFKINNKKDIETKPLIVVITKSEEVGNFGASRLHKKHLSAKRGFIFDKASPLGSVISKSPYYIDIDLIITGKEAHASTPAKAINVIDILSECLMKIKLGKVNKDTLVNLGVLKAGYVRNTIPGNMEILFEVRSFTEKNADFYVNQIINTFKKVSKKHGAHCKSNVLKENVGYSHNINDDFIQETINKINEFGLKSSFEESWSCSDANILNDHGMKIINLGNGARYAHSKSETISVANLIKLRDLIFFLALARN